MDEEARAKLHAFEERIAGVEGSAREALELGKKALATPPAAPQAPATGWWSKPATGANADLRIKSVDGQDVSALITQLVDNAVSRIEKDGIAKPDFAMHSAGARVIPSLTSPDLELRPKGLGSQIAGLFTGKGYFGFLPPITALHHDTHPGRCWPFASCYWVPSASQTCRRGCPTPSPASSLSGCASSRKVEWSGAASSDRRPAPGSTS